MLRLQHILRVDLDAAAAFLGLFGGIGIYRFYSCGGMRGSCKLNYNGVTILAVPFSYGRRAGHNEYKLVFGAMPAE